MPNQFYVAPASGGALKGLTAGLQGLTAYNQNQNEIGRQDAAKQEAKQAQQADAELVKQIQGKDPEALFALMQTNPQLAQNVMKATGFIDGQQRQASADSMLEYLGGGDVEQAVMTQVEVLKQMGKDPKAVLQWGLMPESEQKRKFAETALALNATPEQWNRYQSMNKAPEKTKLQQGTGDMSGYSFNPETGEYSIDPGVKARLTAKAEQKAIDGAVLDAKDRQSINRDVTGLVKDAVLISKASKDLKTLRKTSSPTDQLAAVFKLMKALDPSSVVREGEQQQAVSTGGPAEILIGFVNKIKGDGALPPEAFDNMVDTAESLAGSQIEATNREVFSYLDAYEDTLPESFKSKLIQRIPKSTKQERKKLYSGALSREVSEQDIQDTLKANQGLTRDELLKQLGIK